MILLFLAALLPAELTVTLPAEARVGGTEMTLGQVAALEGGTPEDLRRAAVLPLGYTPAPGFSRLLQRPQIAQLLRRALPEARFALRGAEHVRVLPATEVVTSERLEATAFEALRGRAGEGVEIRPTQRPPAVEVPTGHAPPELRPELPAGELTAGSISVAVRILVDGQPYRTVWVAFELDVWRDVAVLMRNVARGQVIEASMVEMRRHRLAEKLPAEAVDAGRLVGQVAERNLAAGHVVTAADVSRPTLVRAGDVVHLEVRKGPVAAKVRATAESNGARGDRIRVRVSEEREMTATVIRRDLVRIDLAPGDSPR